MRWPATILSALAIGLAAPAALRAQSFRAAGTEFNAVRDVLIRSFPGYTVVVADFLHHGEIAADGRNVAVIAGNGQLVPSRVLQLGPGDYCRLAFETVPKQMVFHVLYGGSPPDPKALVNWTSKHGLLLETRRFRPCDLRDLASVRDAFHASEPIGADFVASVGHGHNPFASSDAPFLSRYSGWLHLPEAGVYGFFTSSRDCSFLLIDDQVVVSAPGKHGPARRATPGSRKDVWLPAGEHKFEYYHASAGPGGLMSAVWEVNPSDAKPRPTAIPGSVFRNELVRHESAGAVRLRTQSLVPDFQFAVVGDVPLPDNKEPLLGVRFTNRSPRELRVGWNFHWDFGDGQSGTVADLDHIYLHPGTYRVTLTARRGAERLAISNRVSIEPSRAANQGPPPKLGDYMGILSTYDPHRLDGLALRQLVLAYQAMAEMPPADPDWRRACLSWAARVGKVALLEQTAVRSDEDLLELARLVGPIARDVELDSRLAFHIWQGAAARLAAIESKAQCELEAADVGVNDLADAASAKPLLEAAESRLQGSKRDDLRRRLWRIWGDYHALRGDGKAARKAYLRAESMLDSKRSVREQIARRGARATSAEQFLRAGDLERAVVEIRSWQDEFPADKMEGYVTSLMVQYWMARERFATAIGAADQFAAVAANSPLGDRVALLAAECEERRGRIDASLRRLRSLLGDHPGSPLAPEARRRIAALEAKKPPQPAGPPAK